MQSQNLTELLNDAAKFPSKFIPQVKKDMATLSEKNAKDLEDKPLPDYLRIPDAEELTNMRQWAVWYKKNHTQASKRQIRKAVQEHFHIKIYR